MGGYTSFWTDLSKYDTERADQTSELRSRFARTASQHNTIVFEPFNLFFKVFDVENEVDELKLNDPLLRQLCFVEDKTRYLLTFQVFPSVLLHKIRKLALYYELVIFTILPR